MKTKIRSVIVDDEQGSIETLRLLLAKYCPEVLVVDTFIHPQDAVEGIKRLAPDLLFLDIEMPFLNAFDLLDKFSAVNFEVVFVTAFNNYALRAIKYAAIDYILKPVNIDDLVVSVERAKRQILLREKEVNIRVQGLLDNIKQPDETTHKMTLATLTGFEVEDPSNVLYIQADGTYSKIHLISGKTKVVSKGLKEFEELLSTRDFIRVHHSFLVNVKYVTRYLKGRGGVLLMTNGHEVEVSVRRKQEVLNRFGY